MECDIEDMVNSCLQCVEKQNMSPKAIQLWEPASDLWERVYIDYAGPTNGQQNLIVVDAFTKWVNVLPTRTTSSTWSSN